MHPKMLQMYFIFFSINANFECVKKEDTSPNKTKFYPKLNWYLPFLIRKAFYTNEIFLNSIVSKKIWTIFDDSYKTYRRLFLA
jgi:hypothetical protein